MLNFNNFKIPIYSIMLFLSLIISFLVIFIKLNKSGIEKEKIILSYILNLVLIVFFGKMFTMLTNLNKNYNILNCPLTSYGCAIGLILSILIFTSIYNDKKGQFLKVYFLVIPLIYSVAKLGCFFAGCCRGIPYNGIFSVYYTRFDTSYFPIQLMETLCFLIIFIVFLKLYKLEPYKFISFLLISCSISKFLLDFLRVSHIGVFLSINQIVSIIFFIVGLILLIKKKPCNKC